MSRSEKSETNLLEFTAAGVKAGQLEMQIRNVTSAPLGAEPMLIEIKLPVEWVDERIGNAARNARTSDSPPNMASLGGVVGVAAGWSIWAFNDPNDHLAAIRVFNNIDQKTGSVAGTLAKLDAGASLSLHVPLRSQTSLTQITIPYSYQSGGRKGPRVDGSIEVTPPAVGNWKPRVSLTTDQPNPMMIPFTTKVKISWKIADAVGAVLRGPLSGGHSELRLSSDRNSDFWIEDGAIEVRAVGPVTYLLDAEVKGPSGPPNVQVVRTISLDISKAENYGSLRVLPDRALPHDQVEIQWAVWGVKNATILFGSHLAYDLELTEQDLSRNYQGVGIWPVRIPGDHKREVVSLRMKNDDEALPSINRDILVASWNKTPQNAKFTGKPVGLAYGEKNLGLLTSDGFWLALVGGNDTELKDPDFRKVSAETLKNWLALTVFDQGFVTLRQTAGGDLQLMRFAPDGRTSGLPMDLPGDLKLPARLPGASFQLAAFGNRVYVVVQSATRETVWALSVTFEPKNIRSETLLEQFPNYRFAGFNGGLYALSSSTGEMLRFDLKPTGELESPRLAASAIQDGKSMVRTGLPLSLGQVLIVLGPSAVSQFDDVQPKNLLGAAKAGLQGLSTTREAPESPQDLVYNPQKDKWATCGRGLAVQAGALAAFRGSASKRLWLLQPNGEIHTLQDAGQDLFAPDHVPGFPSKVLPFALDVQREFTIQNQSGIRLVPVDTVCKAAGLTSLSAAGPAIVTPLQGELRYEKFTLQYHGPTPGPIKLRFQVYETGLGGPRYLLELTFSGLEYWERRTRAAEQLSVTSVFTRLASGEQGEFSIAEVPGSTQEHSPPFGPFPGQFLLRSVAPLAKTIDLNFFNSTPYELRLPEFGDPVPPYESARAPFGYDTPNFHVTVPEAEAVGKLRVEIDFARPFGIEASYGPQAQKSLLHIVCDDENMLEVMVAIVKKGSPNFKYEMPDGSPRSLGNQSEDVFVCVIKYKGKRKIDMVRIGDAVASPDGKRLYVPLAKPENAALAEVWSFDSDSFNYDRSPFQFTGGAFSVPNTLAAWQDKLYVMLGDKTLYELDYLLNVKSKRDYPDYNYITALAATASGDLFLLAEKQQPIKPVQSHQPKVLQFQFLLVERASGQRSVFNLDDPKVPLNVSTISVSFDGKKVAIGKDGGLLVLDIPSGKLNSVDIPAARQAADVMFSGDGAWIYCANAVHVVSGSIERRIQKGGELTISRVRAGNLAETRTLSLPYAIDDFGMTGNTKQVQQGEKSREYAAFRMALSPDDRSLFVSVGQTIYKIDTASFTLLPWRKKVELSCRVFHVKEGKKNTWTVFALGSDYVGDGTTVNRFKTHLYSFSAPKP